MNFDDLTLSPPILKAIKEAGYTTPSPVQEKAIPPALKGRDVLACAQTGTGKTAAFSLPILQILADEKTTGSIRIRCLILTPTRELAIQIGDSLQTYGKNVKLRSTVIFGGVNQASQVKQLQKGVDILVATPGRLNDLIQQGFIKLDQVKIFVLDEADRMLDMGFIHDVRKVLKRLPAQKQTLLFSATMPDEIIALSSGLLTNPEKVFVTPVSSTVERIEQLLYKVDKANKRDLLAFLLAKQKNGRTLVFTRTKHGADKVVRELLKKNIKAMAIHGNKSQNARQSALANFKNGTIKVMVATDIAARGLDIDELELVINYDLPNIPETYVHRIGRTGRAGKGGSAVSFCCFDELEYLTDIEKLIGFAIPLAKENPWPMKVLEKSVKKQGNGPTERKEGKKRMEQGTKAKPAIKTGGEEKQEQRRNKAPHQNRGAKKNEILKPTTEKVQTSTPKPAPQKPAVQQKTQAGKPAQRQNNGGKPVRRERGNRPPGFDPYNNLTGGKAIVTKRPVWSNDSSTGEAPAQSKGENGMKNTDRQTKNKKPYNKPKEKTPEIPKNEKGVFDFPENALSEDKALQVISRANKKGDTKYANFEEFLKDR